MPTILWATETNTSSHEYNNMVSPDVLKYRNAWENGVHFRIYCVTVVRMCWISLSQGKQYVKKEIKENQFPSWIQI